jgi:predicted phage terminase large subunit-like protein
MLFQRSSITSQPSLAAQFANALEDGSYRTKARPEQLPPEGTWWNGWVVCAGRGFGKSWIASNYANEQAQKVGHIALIGQTADAVRGVMVEGPAGILATAPSWFRPEYSPATRRVIWPNGAVATLFSAEEPDRLRGPQHGIGILDEFAAFDNLQAVWDMFSFGLRLGKHPHFLITTTPRPLKLLREIMGRSDVVVTKGSTFDNEANLAPSFLEAIKSRHGNTRLGRQELYAEILTDVPGALWQLAWIDDHRVNGAPMFGLDRIVVAIDPAVTSGEDSDETGIIVAGIDSNGHAYVLEDASGRYQPHEWAAVAIKLYRKHDADRIVAEVNNGGQLVENVLRSVDPSVAFKAVRASRGKVTRAEPVSALYEQGRVHHCGVFTQLEDQMCSFTSDFSKAKAGFSPDRLDALVWAVSELLLEKQVPLLWFG